MIAEYSQLVTPPFLQPKIDINVLIRNSVPMMSGSVSRISSLLSDVNVSPNKLTEAISYDPILTARILRLANSPIYSLLKSVSTLRQAIDVVGMKPIYEILIVGLASDSFAKEIRDSSEGKAIWEHSLAVALLSRELSKVLGLRGTEETFICGLLHDIGKILLLRNDFGRFSEVITEQNESSMLHAESAMFGYNHAQIGSLVASRWGLPEGVCHTILNHHNPAQSEHLSIIAHLVSAADTIANASGYGLREVDNENIIETDSAIMLNLSVSQIETAWKKTAENLSEIMNTFA
jgi:putative nucleotidyltransferase with HDIG domain